MVSRTAALALLAVACLVLAGAAPVPGAATTGPPSTGGDHALADWVLTLGGAAERTAVGDVGLDVARSVDTQRSDAVLRLDRIGLRRRLQSANSDEARFNVLQEEIESINVRLNGLYAAEQAALDEYRAGSITARDYLHRTAFLDARVDQYLDTASLIEAEGEAIQAASVRRDVSALRTRAALIGGPIQEVVRSASRGAGDPASIRVEAGPHGYVAAGVVGGAVVRQSQRYDLRAEDGPTNDLRTSLDHVYAQYPDETDQSPSINVGGQQSVGVFFVTITTSSNVAVTSYVDNRNLTVFKEVYRKPLSQLAVQEVGSVEQGGIRLSVDRDPAAGVLRVRTRDAETGDPVPARVTVDGAAVGSTGSDGSLWTVDRPGPAAVSASAGANRSATLQVPDSS